MTKPTPNRISHLRKQAGLTQQDLAKAVGTHWITISKIERGVTRLNVEWMNKLAPHLGVKAQDMMLDEDDGPGAPGDAKSDRLREARLNAGFASATDAARNKGWTVGTYLSHENGTRGIKHKDVLKYAVSFGVDPSWLEFGEVAANPAVLHRSMPSRNGSLLDRLTEEHVLLRKHIADLKDALAQAERELSVLEPTLEALSAASPSTFE